MKKDDQDDNNEEAKNATKAPRRPRRAADVDNASPIAADKKDGDINSPNSKDENRTDRKDLSEAVIDKPRRKRSEVNNSDNKSNTNAGGGWMSSSSNNTAGAFTNNHSNMINMEEDDPKDAVPQTNQNNKDKHFQDDNDEIILIPDLDEEGGADSDQRIARAPRNVRKIPTLAELEKEVKTTAAAAVGTNAYEGGLNLGVLLNTLVPSSMVYEADVAWTFESLLREVTDELSNTPKIVISSQTVTTIPDPATATPPSKTIASKQTPNNNVNSNSPVKTKKK